MKPLSIQIMWSDNEYLHNMSIDVLGRLCKIFTSFPEIDTALTVAASMRKRKDAYDTIQFTLRYGTEQYEGYFYLHSLHEEQETSTGKISVSQSIKDYCTWEINNRCSFYASRSQQWLNYLAEMELAGY